MPAGADTGPSASNGSTQRTLGIVGMGVGGAGIVVGAITGVLALGKHSTLSSACPGGACPASANETDTINSYHSIATISTIGFIAGGVLAAGGAVLFFTAPHRNPAPATGLSVTPVIGFGTVGAVGRF